MIHDFTPVPALLGGVLIGLSAGLLMLYNGRVAGICGILGGVLPPRGDAAWRFAFLAGLLAVGIAFGRFAPMTLPDATPPTWNLVVGGLLVGFGTRLGTAAPVVTESAAWPAALSARWWPCAPSWPPASSPSTSCGTCSHEGRRIGILRGAPLRVRARGVGDDPP